MNLTKSGNKLFKCKWFKFINQKEAIAIIFWKSLSNTVRNSIQPWCHRSVKAVRIQKHIILTNSKKSMITIIISDIKDF